MGRENSGIYMFHHILCVCRVLLLAEQDKYTAFALNLSFHPIFFLCTGTIRAGDGLPDNAQDRSERGISEAFEEGIGGGQEY